MSDLTCSVLYLIHRDGGAVLEGPRLVGRHGDDGDAEVDPQHVDDAEAEEGEAGNQVAPLDRPLVETQRPIRHLVDLHVLRNGMLLKMEWKIDTILVWHMIWHLKSHG